MLSKFAHSLAVLLAIVPFGAQAQDAGIPWGVDDQFGVISDQRVVDHNSLSAVGISVLADMLPPEDYGSPDYLCERHVFPPGGPGQANLQKLSFEEQVKFQERMDKCIAARARLADHFGSVLKGNMSFRFEFERIPLRVMDTDLVDNVGGGKDVRILLCGLPRYLYGPIGDFGNRGVNIGVRLDYPGFSRQTASSGFTGISGVATRYGNDTTSCGAPGWENSNVALARGLSLFDGSWVALLVRDLSVGSEFDKSFRSNGLSADIDCIAQYREQPEMDIVCAVSSIVLRKSDGSPLGEEMIEFR